MKRLNKMLPVCALLMSLSSSHAFSAEPSLTLSQEAFAAGEDVAVIWANMGYEGKWYAIIEAGSHNKYNFLCEKPANIVKELEIDSTYSETYVGGLNGGDYILQGFDSSNCYIGEATKFSVESPEQSLKVRNSLVRRGNSIEVIYSKDEEDSTDWVGIIRRSHYKGQDCTSMKIKAEKPTQDAEGELSFDTYRLKAGNYYAQMFSNDGFCKIGNPVGFTVTSK